MSQERETNSAMLFYPQTKPSVQARQCPVASVYGWELNREAGGGQGWEKEEVQEKAPTRPSVLQGRSVSLSLMSYLLTGY